MVKKDYETIISNLVWILKSDVPKSVRLLKNVLFSEKNRGFKRIFVRGYRINQDFGKLNLNFPAGRQFIKTRVVGGS